MSLRYFLLDSTHRQYRKIERVCNKRHKIPWPGNVLSVVPNNDDTKVLIKVDGTDSTWEFDNGLDKVGGLVLDIFQPIDHFRAVQLLHEAEWSWLQEANS